MSCDLHCRNSPPPLVEAVPSNRHNGIGTFWYTLPLRRFELYHKKSRNTIKNTTDHNYGICTRTSCSACISTRPVLRPSTYLIFEVALNSMIHTGIMCSHVVAENVLKLYDIIIRRNAFTTCHDVTY